MGCTEEMEEGWELRIKSRFEEPFHRKGFDLTRMLGDRLYRIEESGDTVFYDVKFNRDTRESSIVESYTGAVYVKGLYAQSKGILYFSSLQLDSSYWIHALKFDETGVRGWRTDWRQMYMWDEKFEEQYLQGINNTDRRRLLLKLCDTVNDEIILRPIKREVRRFVESYIDSLELVPIFVYEIPQSELGYDTVQLSERPDDTFVQIYPNPVCQIPLNIEHNLTGKLNYSIYNHEGREVKSGMIESKISKLDLDILRGGTYSIALTDEKGRTYKLKFWYCA